MSSSGPKRSPRSMRCCDPRSTMKVCCGKCPAEFFSLNDPEALPALGYLLNFGEFGIGKLAIGDDRREMIAHLADDVDREEQLFAASCIVDIGGAPGGQI